MKTQKAYLVGAVIATIIATTSSVPAEDFFLRDLANKAVAASPRALEQFPWLSRTTSTVRSTPTESAVSIIRKHRALAASPRMLEEYPELARAEQLLKSPVATPDTGGSQFSDVIRNRALAASPRALEQFPWLSRGYKAEPATQTFQVAPIK
ncbi:MAG: hypothetical protein KF833_02730 [Verrucomicrobiae bacterium]|nr:hypothetical protein [Verrucomicrobiae bacterium]